MDDAAKELAKQGVTRVFDLRNEPPEAEKEQYEAIGIRWVNVPVAGAEPKKADFEDFSVSMAASECDLGTRGNLESVH